MKQSQQQSINIKEIRDIANRFDSGTLEECMQLALGQKDNPCYPKAEIEEVMNILAKAGFVRSQIESGSSVSVAMRELGKRMRLIQGDSDA